MFKPSGSWVAIPTPFDSHNKVDFGVFQEIIDFHVAHGTTMLFCMGSAGEVSMLSNEERHAIVPQMVKMAKGKLPVFFRPHGEGTDIPGFLQHPPQPYSAVYLLMVLGQRQQ